PDGDRVAFLRSRGGADPVTCLWVLDVATGEERLIADPAEISPASEADPEEKTRRERSRERASGIVSFAADAGLRTVAFGLGGPVYGVALTAGTGPARARDLGALTPAADPRPDPAARLVAYVHAGALRVIDLASGQDTAVATPGQGEEEVTFGLAE